MRTHSILMAGLLLACESTAPSGDGSVAVSIATTGLDVDPNGYGLTVDGTEVARVELTDAMTLIRLDPGDHTVALTELTPNCAPQGSTSRTITVIANEVVSVEFAVVCTATTGTVAVVLTASGSPPDGPYRVTLDADPARLIEPDEPVYLGPVTGGGHLVALHLPANCEVETRLRSVTVAAGGLVRDTLQVAFSVVCAPEPPVLRITAAVTGDVPPDDFDYGNEFHVSLWDSNDFYGDPVELGSFEAGGVLETSAAPGEYQLKLLVPFPCVVEEPNPTPSFTVHLTTIFDYEFQVTCR